MPAPQLTVWVDGETPLNGDGLNTFLQTCDTADELRAFIGITGMQVYMRGTTAVGDGGQGNFYWNASSTATDDDGATTVVPYGSAAGAWTRIGGGTGPQVVFTYDFQGTLSLTGGQPTLVPYNRLEFQNGGGFSNGVFTPTVAGDYWLSATAYFTGTCAAGQGLSLAFYRNGSPSRSAASTLLPLTSTLSALGSLTISALFRMNGTTDNLAVYAATNTTTGFVTDGGGTPNASYISGFLISP